MLKTAIQLSIAAGWTAFCVHSGSATPVPADAIEWFDFAGSLGTVLLLSVWMLLVRHLQLGIKGQWLMQFGFFIMILATIRDAVDELYYLHSWNDTLLVKVDILLPIGLAIATIALSQWVIRQRLERRKLLIERGNYKQQSQIDVLSGVHNRRFMDDFMANQAATYCVLMIDIDNFKRINDEFGHSEGDNVIRALGKHLQAAIRVECDYAFRYGGEEFLLYLHKADIAVAQQIAEQIRLTYAELTFTPAVGETFATSISIGLANRRNNESYKDTIHRADSALYQAKNSGKNRVILAD